jgi:hypothetical protein
MRRFAIAVLLSLPLATLSYGCSGDCYDCGSCGLSGGPLTADTLFILDKGKDPKGTAALELRLDPKGTCGGDKSVSFWLRYLSAGKVELAPKPAGGALDSSVVKLDGDQYVWTDRTLTASFERPDESHLRLIFTEPGSSTRVLCTPSSPNVDCAVE